jgi:hypothetical protein
MVSQRGSFATVSGICCGGCVVSGKALGFAVETLMRCYYKMNTMGQLTVLMLKWSCFVIAWMLATW